MKTAIAVTVIWVGTVGSCTGVSQIQPQEEQLSTNIPTADREGKFDTCRKQLDQPLPLSLSGWIRGYLRGIS